MPSKAQGLSLNTIVIAAIVLVVLLILVGMTTGYFRGWVAKFGKVSDTSCSDRGGEVKQKCSDIGERDEGSYFDDVKSGQTCCVSCGSAEGKACCRTETPCNINLECKNDVCVSVKS